MNIVLRKYLGNLLYKGLDFVAAALAWTFLFIFRRIYNENGNFNFENLQDKNYLFGIILIPIFWLIFYKITDSYGEIYRMSRLKTFFKTICVSIIGIVIIFFVFLLDDHLNSYKDYYNSLFVLGATHIGLTLLFRLSILAIAKGNIKNGSVGYNTLLIGNGDRAIEIFNDLNKKPKGYFFKGYICANQNKSIKDLQYLGHTNTLNDVIASHGIEEVIIAPEVIKKQEIQTILNSLNGSSVIIKVSADLYDIMLGNVRMDHILGVPLIAIKSELMPTWQRFMKRIMDILVSAFTLFILSPMLAFVAIRVKLSSPGPIFFQQERIGKGGIPFNIIKFRSMLHNAERYGPKLSTDTDKRITKWGKVMRKYRLDEFPQFWNVLRGDMSLVGPRPERQYYIDQIIEKAPHWNQLLKVKPGITSWGQVKYGYASEVDEMVDRLKFDILYIENMSISLDIKIILYTFNTLLKGEGK